MYLRFLDVLAHLWKHPAPIDIISTTTPRTSNSQNHLKRNILPRLGETAISIFEGGSSGRYIQATADKIIKNCIFCNKAKMCKVDEFRMSFCSFT